MPHCRDVERHCADVVEGERQYCQKRVQREEVRLQRAADAGTSKVATAAAEAQRISSSATANAEAAVSVAEVRLRQDRERLAKDLEQAEQRLADAFLLTEKKVQAAEQARDAARPQVAERIQNAEKARRDAVASAEHAASEAEELCEKRIADANGRADAAEARSERLRKEAEERSEQRSREQARMVAKMKKDSVVRHERLERATADRVDRCVSSLRGWLLRLERDWETTQTRIDSEMQRAQKLTAAERRTIQVVSQRRETCAKDVDETMAQASRSSGEAFRYQAECCLKELQYTAEELEAIDGLQDIAQRLRNGKLWREMDSDD